MASDMLIKIDSIMGETEQEGFANFMEIENWAFGASNTAIFGTGSSGGGVGKPTISDLTFTKFMDKATVGIGKALFSGTHLKEATLVLRKAGGGETNYTYLTVTMTDVVVTSQQFSGSSGPVVEALSIAFKSVKFDYASQNSASGAVSSVGNFSYDVATGKPLAK